jgi:hypothetical protein
VLKKIIPDVNLVDKLSKSDTSKLEDGKHYIADIFTIIEVKDGKL